MMPKNSSSRYTWLVVVSLFIVWAPSLMAQTAATGALTGTVTDETSAVVPNATVTVTSADTGQARTVTTDAAGTYKVSLLPPGSYRVKFEASGFKTVEVPSIKVNVTETNVLDSRVEVGSQAQEITVQGEVENVQTSNATVGTVMASKTVTDLPLTTRNYTNLLGLSAGANTGVFNAANLGKGSQNIAVNGSSTAQNNFQMDGVSIVNWGNAGSIIETSGYAGLGIPNPDSIQEFKIQTSQYDAGYGRNPGANVNVVTKSGTNQFHGTAFEFFRNTDLNANDFFRKISPAVNGVPNDGRQVLNQNQYGGVVGGPVKKDKLFFFASYQETWQKNGIASAGYTAPTLPPVPTGDRSNTAALRIALGAAICPANNPGNKSDQTFQGGVQVACNGSNINPVAVNILQLKNPDGSYAIPSSGNGLYQSTTFSIPALYREHQGIANVDYVINSKNTVSGRDFYATDPTTLPFNCGSSAPGPPGVCLPGTDVNTQFTNHAAVLKLTSILTSNVVNEARISFQRNVTTIQAAIPTSFTDTAVGIAPIVPTINQLDYITVTGLFTIGANPSNNSYQWINQLQAADQISWTHGRHTIRAGFEYGRQQKNNRNVGFGRGALTFSTFPDFLLGLPGCAPGTFPTTCSASNPGATNGTQFSNINNSGTFSSVIAPGGLVHAYRAAFADGFVQDDIKVKQGLTVNLGLRWEYDGLEYDKYGHAGNLWPSLIQTVPVPGATPATGTLAGFVVPSNFNAALNAAPPVGGVFQSDHRIAPQNNPPIDNFAPRIGFAWQPAKSDRLVVRGGFGYFYDYLSEGNYDRSVTQATPYNVIVSQTGQANYFSTFAQPYAPTSLGWTPRWVDLVNGTSSNLNVYILQQNFVTPLTFGYNLNTQYEFLPTWVLEVGYVGSHGIHQLVAATPTINEAQLASPNNPINGIITTNTVSNASLRVPYLGFAPNGLSQQGVDGDDKFNSLQVTVRKQMSHGLMLQAAYTWSRSFTTGTLGSNDPNNHAQQYGLNPSYYPQRLAVNYSWDLPFGRPEGFKGKLINGWNLSGVTIVQDGTPLTITDTRGGTIYGSVSTPRAEFAPGMGNANVATPGGVEQRLGGDILGGPGYFNKAAFGTIPTIGATPGVAGTGGLGYGNSGIGILLGPGQFNWDMSLVKTTKVGGLTEDATLQFRTEFFNAFNHPQFNNPAVVDVSKSTFGQITSTSVNPRVMQFALKYAF